jgi:hypothetical protein
MMKNILYVHTVHSVYNVYIYIYAVVLYWTNNIRSSSLVELFLMGTYYYNEYGLGIEQLYKSVYTFYSY